LGYGALTGQVFTNSDFETDGLLESTQEIQANTTVDYDSGTAVQLLPGFETILGAEFLAFIDGCNGTGGLLLHREVEKEK